MAESEIITVTAKRLADTANSRGDAAVYELSPPYVETSYSWSDSPREPIEHKFVVVSAVDLDFGGISISDYRSSETMIFPSDGEGVSDFWVLVMVPYKSHADALSELGYTIEASK